MANLTQITVIITISILIMFLLRIYSFKFFTRNFIIIFKIPLITCSCSHLQPAPIIVTKYIILRWAKLAKPKTKIVETEEKEKMIWLRKLHKSASKQWALLCVCIIIFVFIHNKNKEKKKQVLLICVYDSNGLHILFFLSVVAITESSPADDYLDYVIIFTIGSKWSNTNTNNNHSTYWSCSSWKSYIHSKLKKFKIFFSFLSNFVACAPTNGESGF